MIAVKRERYAQALCAYSLLAATLQMAVWFMWNSSLYGLAFIYRLNQSKVYMEYFLYLCRCEAVWICYDIAITESQASILVYLSLLVSSDNASDSVVGKSLGIVWGKIQFDKLIEFSVKPQNETNRNERNNKKQGKFENVVSLIFCFCFVSRCLLNVLYILVIRWLRLYIEILSICIR